MKGLAQAGKKAGRVASEGLIAQYIHAGARCAVLRCPVPPARLARQIGLQHRTQAQPAADLTNGVDITWGGSAGWVCLWR